MRLHIPDYLQKDFHALMNLSYDLKQRHKGLKRSVKFDEEDNGLFMDIKLDEGSDWKRVKPSQARAANMKRKNRTRTLDDHELRSLLGDEGENESE